MTLCHACAFSSMGPGDDYLVCNSPEAGASAIFGTYIKGPVTLQGQLKGCGEERKLFRQHPKRNEDGTLKLP